MVSERNLGRLAAVVMAGAWVAAVPALAQTPPEVPLLASPPQPPAPPQAGPTQPPAPPALAPPSGIPPEQMASYRQRYEALAQRQAALDAANAPADQADLQRLQAARDAAPSEEIRTFVAASLTWYAEQMTGAPVTPLRLPAGQVRLDVAMVGFVLDYIPTDPEGRQGELRPRGAAALQVARVGSPEQAVLWLHDLGYVLIPGNYVEPFVQIATPGQPTLLEIGQ